VKAPRCALLASSVLLAASLAASADEVRWRTLRSEAAGFVARVPGEPSYEYSREWTLGGPVAYHHYEVALARASFDIERFELPAAAVIFYSDEGLLDRARDDLMAELDARLEGEEAFALRGYPARRLRYSRPGVHSHPEESRLYLVGRNLFIVTAGPYDPASRETLVDPFFASFDFCLEGLAPCPAPPAPASE